MSYCKNQMVAFVKFHGNQASRIYCVYMHPIHDLMTVLTNDENNISITKIRDMDDSLHMNNAQ